ICSSTVFAQQKITQKELGYLEKNQIKTPLLQDNDEDFKTTPDASKWSSESAVILCQKTTFNFDRQGIKASKVIGRNIWGALFAIPTLGTSLLYANMRNGETKIVVEETERRKILLKDRYAVDQYSVLYFRMSSEEDVFMARIIKKDGSTQKVDFSDAIKVEDIKQVPGLFRSYTDAKYTAAYRPDYFKVAVPDLEEGDILEYEFRHQNSQQHYNNPSYKEFDPVYYLCNRELPVAKQVIEVVTEDDRYFIGYKSLKGAPQFQQTVKEGKKIYRWSDGARDKMEDTRYVNEFMEMPGVKFQVIYARKTGKSFLLFASEEDMKRDMDQKELGDKAKTFWFNPEKLQVTGDYTEGLSSGINGTISDIYKTFKKKGITSSTDDEYVRKAYYYIRSQTLYNNWSDYAFAKVFSGLLKEKKLDHEILVSAPNHRTRLENIAFTQELSWVIKYKGKYYCNPAEHLNPEELPTSLSGNMAIKFNAANSGSQIASETFPLGDSLTNKLHTTLKLSLQPNMTVVQVNKTVEAEGQVKEDLLDEVLTMTPFMENDYRNYDGVSMWEGIPEKSQEKARSDFDAQKKEWKEEKPKMMKALAESDYGFTVEKYSNFKLQQDGRSHRKRDLKYMETFTMSDVTAKAGEELIFPLPVFMGSQPKIRTEELKRNASIDLRYPRSLVWSIQFTLPAGYTAKGLENLNKAISNPCGSFHSVARLENNMVILDVKKVYNSRYFEASQWNHIVSLLEAAHNLSQSKLVLTKVQ
ncbi:MAG TPA: hypothetical protein VGD26_08300, partial [Chitinophagaceae bacterium]